MKKAFKILIFLLFISTNAHSQYNKYYFFNLGREHILNGDFSKAINSYNVLISADSTLYDAFFLRGIAKYNLSDYIGALSDFNRAIDINPVYTQAFHYRAITKSQLNQPDEAEKDYEMTVYLRPDYFGVYFSRGVSYLIAQQFDKAIADFNKFLRSEPTSGSTYINRGTAYLHKKDTVSALRDYNRAMYFNPFEPSVYVRRSRIYALQDKLDLAIQDINRAIELDPNSPFSYFNRALMRYNNKNINGAIEDLGTVVSLDPNNALSYYNRALIRSQIGDYNAALDDYTKVTQINPRNVLAYYNRAAVYIELNAYRNALQDYNKAIELYPDFANAYLNRSFVKSKMGQFNAAKRDYDIAQNKIEEYRSKMTDSAFSVFADTSKTFSKLLNLDADFTKSSFNEERLSSNVDENLIKQYQFMYGAERSTLPLDKQFFHPKLTKFLSGENMDDIALSTKNIELRPRDIEAINNLYTIQIADPKKQAFAYFLKGMEQGQQKQYASAINYYNRAIELDPTNIYFYLNRSAVQSAMIEFVSAMEDNMPRLSLDDDATFASSIVKETRQYNYQEAIDDLDKVEKLDKSFTYLYYNRGILNTLSKKFPEAMSDFNKAIGLYPSFGEAYFNRGLVSIHLHDSEKGCLDISKSGELGIEEAYSAIKKFCIENE